MLITEALERHATDRPHAPAAADAGRSVDYETLAAEVRTTAAALRRHGVGPGDRVAICLPNGLDFLVAALASAWVSATFVPLAPADPARRRAQIVADCQPALVLTASAADAGRLAGHPPVTVDGLRAAPGAGAPHPAPAAAPAYMIYTSGTTGTPKGVVIGHPAFTAALEDVVAAVDMGPRSRLMCVSSFHFDGSFGNLFGGVYAGGFVTIPDRARLVFPRNFVRWVERHGVDVTSFSPSYLRLLLTGRDAQRLAGGSLRVVAVGGEAASAADLLALQRAAPQVAMYNRYGPTETTIAVSHHRLLPDELEPGRPVPIGRPHPGVTFHLRDEQGRPVTDAGLPGELWIGGDQLMDGYWAAPDLTAGVLRDDVAPGGRAYRTGDLVSVDGDGVHTWHDRVDRVVKRSGVRISLAEVSAALSAAPGVSAAVAVAHGAPPDTEIVAFVVSDRPAAGLRASAAELVPETMLPDAIEVVPAIPLTTAGKVDERRLLTAWAEGR